MKPQKPCDIWKIARECGVTLRDSGDNPDGPRKPRECYAKGVLRNIGRRHGERHLALVLRLIVQTKGNNRELYASTLWAISHLLNEDPHIVESGGFGLFEIFDQIDLAGVRQQAKAMRIRKPTSHIMQFLLEQRIAEIKKGEGDVV